MDIWKISSDQDGSTATDLSEFSSSIYVNLGIPKVKYNALSVLGHQGDIDITAAYNGEVFYEPRECTVTIMSNSGANITASSVARSLIDDLLGQRVRLRQMTQNYMLIGRLTEAEYEELPNGKDYKIRFKLIAEPLRYSLTEQVIDDTQLSLTTPANQWATLTAGKEYATQTGFSASAGNLPLIPFSIEPESGILYYRIEVSNLVNCTVRGILGSNSGKNKLVDISQPILGDGTYTELKLDIMPIDSNAAVSGHVYVGTYTDLYLDVSPIDSNAAVSGKVYVGTYPTILFDYNGKSVPVKARQTISSLNNDIYLVVNGMSAKLKSGWEFHEYPQLMLKSGINYIMAYASKMDFDQSSLSPNQAHMQIKWRKGEL